MRCNNHRQQAIQVAPANTQTVPSLGAITDRQTEPDHYVLIFPPIQGDKKLSAQAFTFGQAAGGGGSAAVDQLLAVGQDEAQVAEGDGVPREFVKGGKEEHVGQGHLGRGRARRPGDACPERGRGGHAGF